MSHVKNNEKIKYFGVIDFESILLRQKNTDLLINPRPSIDEYTKYSFPSKIMEYMASGTPVLTTKLSGIPMEYYDYYILLKMKPLIELKNQLFIH